MIIYFAIIVILIFGFNRRMGYKKGNITLDLDDCYYDYEEHTKAVKHVLEEQGRVVRRVHT